MATKSENHDIQTLKTDVALIKQRQSDQTSAITDLKETVATNQTIIIDRMEKFAYVTLKDYTNDELRRKEALDALETRVTNTEKFLNTNKSGIESSTKVTSGVGKLVFGAIVLAVFAAIIYFGVLVAPALGGIK